MPYINPDRRKENIEPVSSGDLNYAITRLCDDYLNLQGLSYFTINEVIGVLECAKLELYRRIAAPYEDQKIIQNGDVYTIFKKG
jgi:hypothetical protein